MLLCRLYQPWASPQYEVWTTAGEGPAFFLSRKNYFILQISAHLAGMYYSIWSQLRVSGTVDPWLATAD